MSEYNRQELVYNKEDLLISGQGKYHGYSYYQQSGVAIKGKLTGEGAQDSNPPVDIKSLLP